MILNYLKIAWRNLLKNKVYSFINIGGLAVGFACCVTIGLFVFDELSYDKFHSNGKYIYRITEKQPMMGAVYSLAVTPGPLAPALKSDFQEVVQTCRIEYPQSGLLQFERKSTESDKVFVTDNSLFSMFDFTLEKGNAKTVLTNADEIVISEKMADKLFGNNWRNADELIGKMLLLNKTNYILKGIAKNPTSNSHIQFEILLSCKSIENQKYFNWDNHNFHTYVQLNPQVNAAVFGQKISDFIHIKAKKTPTPLSLQPLYDIYLHSDFAFQTDWSKTSNILYIKIFSLVGIIVLIIALFNFINLATARAVQRAKEVGVRKSIGAFRGQLIFQFLGESMLMSIFAIFISLLLLNIFLPLMNNIASKSIEIPYTNPYFIFAICGLMLLVGLLAGIYPAFYLSKFQPVKVLKGIVNVGKGQVFRRSLVVSQFIFSIMLILGTIVIYRQLSFLQNKDLGFDKSQLLVVKMKNELEQNANNLKQDLLKQSSIMNVASASSNIVDMNNSTGAIHWDGQVADDKFKMTQLNIDPNFLATTGMKLLAGRTFDSKIASDSSSAYIINETAAKRMGWTADQAINKNLTLWDIKGKVIGVVKDFNFRPLNSKIEPLLFRYWIKEGYQSLFIKTSPNKVQEAISVIGKVYKQYDKQTELQYEFVDQTLNNQYRAEQLISKIILYFAILAIFVSCLGLFGLATFSAEQRTKEIGIRKILGASVLNITTLLSMDFLKLVLISCMVAFPLGFWAMNNWLQNFAYKIDISWWIFAIAGGLSITTALLTVSYQAIKAALMNPVKSLKTE